MTAAERLDEVAEILAAGLLRVLARKSERNANNSKELRELPLDLSLRKSMCGHEPKHDRESR